MRLRTPTRILFASAVTMLITDLRTGRAEPEIAWDAHQHLVSPAAAQLSGRKPVLARDLISDMDANGIRRALVLSIAYQFSSPNRPPVQNDHDQVKASTTGQRSRSHNIPTAFARFVALVPYAITRCRRSHVVRATRASQAVSNCTSQF